MSEIEYLKDEQARLTVYCGVKGSSKTYNLLNTIKCYLLMNKIDEYHLILPCYSIDNNQEQYAFLKQVDQTKGPKILIYKRYSKPLIKYLMDKQLKDKSKRLFVVVDDATSQGTNISSDEVFLEFVTTSRHININLLLIVHSLSYILKTTIRNNIDYLFTFRIVNSKLLELIHHEFFSMYFDTYKDFKKYYTKNVLNVKYNALFLNSLENKFSTDVVNWNMNKKDLVKRLGCNKNNNKDIKVISIDTEKERIIEKIHKKINEQRIMQNLISNK
jgi:hypothetical protein